MRSIRKWSVLLALGLGACYGTTTQVDQTWVSPQAASQPRLQHVATLYISDNVTMRHSAEDRLAIDLQKKGMQAIPSYVVLGDTLDTKNIEAAKAQLREKGYDGVITMRIVERNQELEGMPTYDWTWGGWGWGYPYGYGYSGYAYTETTYRVETAAYDLRNNTLLWSVMTKTTDPETAKELIGGTSQVVTREFVKHGLSG
jgi:hypothetical protein